MSMEKFLKAIKAVGLRLGVKKCEFHLSKVEYCGRVIEGEGWSFDPKFYSKIRDMGKPKFVHELVSAVHVAKWMCIALPRFARVGHRVR